MVSKETTPRDSDAQYLFKAFNYATTPIVINCAPLAAAEGAKVGTIQKRITVLAKRYNLAISTTTKGDGATVAPPPTPAPAPKKMMTAAAVVKTPSRGRGTGEGRKRKPVPGKKAKKGSEDDHDGIEDDADDADEEHERGGEANEKGSDEDENGESATKRPKVTNSDAGHLEAEGGEEFA